MPQAFDSTKPVILQNYFNADRDEGCFTFALDEAKLHFGSMLNKDPIRKERLAAIVEIVARLETQTLVDLFIALIPMYQSQRALHQAICEETKREIDAQSRWIAHLKVSNFGSTGFVIFPERAWLAITGKRVKPIKLEGRVLKESDHEGADWSEVQGVLLIEPNTSVVLAFVTTKVQRDIADGHVVRSLYEGGGAVANCKLRLRGRELPWSRWVKTRRIAFKGS